MAFVRGGQRPPGSGRPKGGRNKTTRVVREIVAEALKRKGGARFLEYLPDELFVELLLRFVPSEAIPKLEREAIRRILTSKSAGIDRSHYVGDAATPVPDQTRLTQNPWLERDPLQQIADMD